MQTRLRVLAVEDSEDDALLLARELRKGGFDADFTRVDTEEGLLSALAGKPWDVALCDYSMPHFSGMAALRIIRRMIPELPIIFVSGTVGEDFAVEAMRAGANDYMMKGNLLRLVPALERELRDTSVRVARRRAEEALRQNEANLQVALEAGGLGEWKWNIVTGETTWSARCKALYGFRPDFQMSFEGFLAAIHPDDRGRTEAALSKAVEDRTDYDVEKRVVWPDGSTHWTASRGRVFCDAGGNPLHMTGVTMDITERKRAEDALRKLSWAVEQSPVSIIITDTHGNIEYVNPKFTQVSGYSYEEVIGQNPRILKSGEVPQEEYKRLWDTIQAGGEWRGEFHNRKKDGTLYWELASISPIVDTAGKITHFLAVKEDITERKRLEEEFRQAQKLEAVGQLAGGVAHDFNNILTAILMHLGLLRDDPDVTPALQSALRELQMEAKRAANLTRQMLLFSRRQMMEAKPIDLNDVVDNMTKMLRRLIGEDIDLSLQGQSTSAWVMADAGMMDQVLLNLCVNARDAMPKGGKLTVSTRRLDLRQEDSLSIPEARPGSHVCLSVADTGCGMNQAILEHIFEPFFTTKEPGKGTGLGLATVYGIVKQHHGWVEVESEEGKGTCFRVFLPALGQTPACQQGMGDVEVRGGTETILLVEDDRSLRRLAALGLRKLGYAVLEAPNGAEAIGRWMQNRERIDLLLTDMIMPGGVSGLDLVQRCQKEKEALRVIVVSGYAAERYKSGAPLGQGIVFLAKPYEPIGLARAVRECLDQPAAPPPA